MKLNGLFSRCFIGVFLCASILLGGASGVTVRGYSEESMRTCSDGTEILSDISFNCTWSESRSGLVFCQTAFDKYAATMAFREWPKKDHNGKVILNKEAKPLGAILMPGHGVSKDKMVVLKHVEYLEIPGGFKWFFCSSDIESPVKIGSAKYDVELGFCSADGEAGLAYRLIKRT